MSLLCAIISESCPETIEKQVQKASYFADLLEFRLDKVYPSLPRTNTDTLLRRYIQNTPKPIIINYPFKEHEHSLEAYTRTLKTLLALKPSYIDLDLSFPEENARQLLASYTKTKVIRSIHLDYSDLAALTLPEIYCTMKKNFAAHLYKIVVETYSTLETLKLFSQSQSLGKDLIFLCSGEYGSPSRILAPINRNPINYSYVPGYSPVASGQLSTKDLLRCNYRSLTQNSTILGLIGHPVKNSIGNVIHNYFLKKYCYDSCYIKFEVPIEEIQATLDIAKKLPFKGLSVTSPLKSSILPFVDTASLFAKQVHAANTLVFRKGKIHAFNTDGQGCLKALLRLRVPLNQVAIVGFGGASRAIALSLALHGSKVTVYNRTPHTYPHLTQNYNITLLPLEDLYKPCATYDLLIQALPAHIPIEIPMDIARRFMDLSTLPKNTPLILSAKEKGIPIVYGYQMFVEQALDQIRLWFPNNYHPNLDKDFLKKTEQTLFFS